MKKALFIIFFLFLLTLQAAKSPPELRWREISRNDITVIFPAACTTQAEYTLASASRLVAEMRPFWQDTLADKIRIVLNDNTDDANGFATFFPYNLISINLHVPVPDSALICSREWIDLVLAHEMTHIFNLNAAASPFHQLRKVFGNMPALFPAMQMPIWVIEGLAVYGESRFSADGRLLHPGFQLMLEAAQNESKVPSWRQINGNPSVWPGATAKYLFGAKFMQFLAQKYGEEKIREYVEFETSRLLLLSTSQGFKQIFGKDLSRLWSEFSAAAPAGLAPEPAFTQLSSGGFAKEYPCPAAEKKLLYARHDYQNYDAVEMLDLENGKQHTLFKLGAVSGLSFSQKEQKIFLSASDFFHAFSDYADLYEYDLHKRHLQRLTYGQRLSEPWQKQDSTGIFCVRRQDNSFHLALFDDKLKTIRTLSRGFPGLAQVCLSPDQKLLAAAVKPPQRPWGIGIFSLAGELLYFISAPNENLYHPRWLDDQRLCFIQMNPIGSRLAGYALDSKTGFSSTVQGLPDIQQFAFSPGGKDLFFTYFTASGLEIGRIAAENLNFITNDLQIENKLAEKKNLLPESKSRPYRFWRDLLPHFWTPSYRLAGDDFQAGILTSGQDALEINRFNLETYYGFSSRRGNILFDYTFDGLFPTLSLVYNDNSTFYRSQPKQNFTRHNRKLKLASLWPLRIRKRSQTYLYADLHLAQRSYLYDQEISTAPSNLNGFCLALNFSSAQEYYDSISPTDGLRLSLQLGRELARWGSNSDSDSIIFDYRQYVSLFRPGVLAWRLALAKSWGGDRFYYAMGGREGEGGSGLGENHPFDLLRGFPAGYWLGSSGYLFNLEYRLPLAKIETSILPTIGLERIYLNIFFDLGQLWLEQNNFSPAYAFGAEAFLRFSIGSIPFDLGVGGSLGFNPQQTGRVYVRLGQAF